MKEITEKYENLWFTVVYKPGTASVEFECYEWMAVDEKDTPQYELKGSGNGFGDCMPDISKAETYITGVVKWDGCSHFYFGGSDNDGYLHLCGKDSIEKHQKIVGMIYKRCGELMEGREKDEFY